MKYLRKYNESTDSKDDILDFYALEEIFLPLSDILDVDMSRIKYDENGKFIYGNNPIYVNLGQLRVNPFNFSVDATTTEAVGHARLMSSITTMISDIDNKIDQLNNTKDKLNKLKEKIDSELPDIIHRLQQYKHFDCIKFGSGLFGTGSDISLVIIVHIKDWDDYRRDDE